MVSERTKELLDFSISALTFALLLILATVFITALYNGVVYGNYVVLVYINRYNEAWIELPIIVILIAGQIRNMRRQYREYMET